MYNVNVSLSSEWPVGDVSFLITVDILVFFFLLWCGGWHLVAWHAREAPYHRNCMSVCLNPFLRMPESILPERRMVLRGDAVEKGVCKSLT